MATDNKDVSLHRSDSVPAGEPTKPGKQDELALALVNYTPGTKEEKRLKMKVGLYMMPMLWWMCVLAYVDRNNIVSAHDCLELYRK